MNHGDCESAAAALGERNDCAVRAISIAFRLAYAEAHELCRRAGRRDRGGMRIWEWCPIVYGLAGRRLTWESAMGITVRRFEKEYAAPRGTYLVRTANHLLCVRNGKAEDFTSGRRHRVMQFARVDTCTS